MNITAEWLKEKSACSDGVRWWKDNGSEPDASKVLRSLMADDKLQWANWTITRLMSREQKIRYAIFAAEQVLDIFEKKYPKDERPRKAIEAAKKVLEADTVENRKAAADAADDAAYAYAYAYAYAAADAYAYAAYAAAYAAADAYAYAAADAAAYAADAYAAATADADAADDATAADDARKKMQLTILEYGISLMNADGGLGK